MIRRFNYTGRRRIARSRIRIRLQEDSSGRSFEPEINLDGLKLPPAAAVFVEAYHRTAYRRYAFGTVEALRRSPDTRLEGFITTRPLFRVKIVEHTGAIGRILAAADRIIPVPSDEDETDRESLLIVEYTELEDGLWKLDLESDWPTLHLNSRVNAIREAARSGSEFLTLVYPEVVRRILTQILFVEQHTDPDCNDDEWTTLWLRFACTELGCPRPPENPDAGEATGWIEQAVAGFCARNKVIEQFREMTAEQGD